MVPFLDSFFMSLSVFFRSRYNLSLEILALRQQLGVTHLGKDMGIEQLGEKEDQLLLAGGAKQRIAGISCLVDSKSY